MAEEILNFPISDLYELENKIGRKTPESLLMWMKDAAGCEDTRSSEGCLHFSSSLSEKLSELKQEMVKFLFIFIIIFLLIHSSRFLIFFIWFFCCQAHNLLNLFLEWWPWTWEMSSCLSCFTCSVFVMTHLSSVSTLTAFLLYLLIFSSVLSKQNAWSYYCWRIRC